MRRALPALFILLLAANFLHAATQEVPVGDPVLGPAPMTRWEPSVGANGNEFFAVWTDSRVIFNEVVGTRLDENGDVLDGAGIAISTGTDFHPAFDPRVIWSGSTWLVFWRSTLPTPPYSAIVAARIDRDGKRIGMPYMLGRGSTGIGQYVATNGTNTVLAFADASGNVPHAMILDRDGALVRDVVLPTAWTTLTHFAVATNGSNFAIAWEALGAPVPEIETITLDGSGNVIEGSAKSLGAGRSPFLASDGTDFMLLSQRNLNGSLTWNTSPLGTSLVDGSGTSFLPDGRLLQSPSFLWRNGHYVVIAQRNSDVEPRLDIVALEVDHNGISHSDVASLGDLRLDSVDPQVGAAATTNGKLAVVWIETSPGGFASLYTRGRVYSSLDRTSSSSTLLLSRSADPHYSQSLAYGNGMLLASWLSTDGIYASRVTLSGHTLDGRGLLIDAFRYTSTNVAFDGTNFVVAYTAARAVKLRFISPAAGLLDEVITIPTESADGAPPSIAITPDAIVLAWVQGDRVVMTRVPHATHIAENPSVVSPELGGTNLHIAWNGTNFLLVWSQLEWRLGSPPIPFSARISALRVSGALTPLEMEPVLLAGDDGYTYEELSVASNGQDWLVVWDRGATLTGRRVGNNGELGEVTPIATSAYLPRVIFDGTRYSLAWKQYDDPHSRLRIASIAPAGPIEVTDFAPVAATDTTRHPAALAATPIGVAVAYARVSNAPEYGGVERTFMRIMKGSSRKRAATH
jgi:hypothetical protein